jgi:hypothetical protein
MIAFEKFKLKLMFVGLQHFGKKASILTLSKINVSFDPERNQSLLPSLYLEFIFANFNQFF